ncbi:hypothetical protein KFK09_020843 [Dendrobium nobile]|uniref:Uncharacterized protein n=1 Tax=Dendrobium nobile TaxID=94219 RepID=A0A8T3ANJ4_DENNO|nr:hypothetical protein KFK09_020843 [Dendrobium nobile]
MLGKCLWYLLNSYTVLQILINSDVSIPCLKWISVNGGTFNSFLQDFYKNERFSTLGWLCFIGGLKTADALIKRNIQVDSSCCLV